MTAAPAAVARSSAVRHGTRAGIAGLVGAAVSGLLGFVLAVVITHGYGVAGAGAMFAAIGLVTVATAVCTLGAETGLLWALPRRRSTIPGPAPGGAVRSLRPGTPAAQPPSARSPDATEDAAARLLPVALLPPLAVATVAVAVGTPLADRLARLLLTDAGPSGQTLMTVAIAALPVTVTAVLLLAALRCVRSIRWYVAVQFLLLPIGRPVLVGVAVLVGGGVALGLAGWLLPAAVALVVCAGLVAGPLGLRRSAVPRPRAADWRTFWSFALPRAVSASIDAGSGWIGVLLTAALAGSADAGVLGAVGRYVLAGQLALQGLRVATAAQLSGLFGAGRAAEATAVHRQLTVWGIVLSWPVYLLLAGFGPAFLQLFGLGFTAGSAALAVLALAMLVNIAVGNVQSLLLMAGHSGAHLAVVVAGLAVHITLGLLLIPGQGVLGAALAWGAGIVVENLGAALVARILLAQPLSGPASLRAAAAVVGAIGGAAVLGTGGALAWAAVTHGPVAVRGVPGLVGTLVVLAVALAILLTHPRVRHRLRAEVTSLRGGGVAAGDRTGKVGVARGGPA